MASHMIALGHSARKSVMPLYVQKLTKLLVYSKCKSIFLSIYLWCQIRREFLSLKGRGLIQWLSPSLQKIRKSHPKCVQKLPNITSKLKNVKQYLEHIPLVVNYERILESQAIERLEIKVSHLIAVC